MSSTTTLVGTTLMHVRRSHHRRHDSLLWVGTVIRSRMCCQESTWRHTRSANKRSGP
jgi:hypothetical protein